MASAVFLRPARAGDARGIALLSRERIEAGLTWQYTPPRVVALLADPDVAAVVAADPSGLQGFALMALGDDSAQLLLLAVQAPLQRRGIGSRLLDWQLRSARLAGIGRVSHELRADNEAGYTFLRLRGFEPVGRVPRRYDGVVAARWLLRPLAP